MLRRLGVLAAVSWVLLLWVLRSAPPGHTDASGGEVHRRLLAESAQRSHHGTPLSTPSTTPPPSPPPPSSPPPRYRPAVTALTPDTVPILPSPLPLDSPLSGLWETRYDPTAVHPMCYAAVRNVCVVNGELHLYLPREVVRFYTPPAYSQKEGDSLMRVHRDRRKGHLGLCNEGMRKGTADVQFRVHVAAGANPPHPVDSTKEFHVTHCWDHFGYHLWFCLLGVWLRGQRHPNATAGVQRVVAVTTVSGMGNTLYLGSTASWGDRHRSEKGMHAYRDSGYWAMWKVVAASPADVVPLWDITYPRCYHTGFVGSPNPYTVTRSEWHRFVGEMRRVLGLVPPSPIACGNRTPAITVVDRSRYRITNIDWVRDALGPSADVVRWETMPLMTQLTKATGTTIMIGTHGNGLTWSAFMPPGGALIELWPGGSYNGNYRRFAELTGLVFREITHGTAGVRYDYNVNTAKLRWVVRDVVGIMDSIACGRGTPSPPPPPTASHWEEVYNKLLRPNRAAYARYGLLKRHWKTVGMELSFGGDWVDILNKAYKVGGVSYNTSGAQLEYAHNKCRRAVHLGNKDKARCLISFDLIKYVRKHHPAEDLTSETWRVPELQAKEEKAAATEHLLQRLYAAEVSARKAGNWTNELWNQHRDSA